MRRGFRAAEGPGARVRRSCGVRHADVLGGVRSRCRLGRCRCGWDARPGRAGRESPGVGVGGRGCGAADQDGQRPDLPAGAARSGADQAGCGRVGSRRCPVPPFPDPDAVPQPVRADGGQRDRGAPLAQHGRADSDRRRCRESLRRRAGFGHLDRKGVRRAPRGVPPRRYRRAGAGSGRHRARRSCRHRTQRFRSR